ncbi:glycosyltransferase family 2 protein [Kineococcus sp. SYSU DK001]|uniref:glycosyltransferase family 2 protein n=1 Tax=Kineococcus sp. SYSU DK001 TaxID=3383122 RepID=UPI003D7EFA00
MDEEPHAGVGEGSPAAVRRSCDVTVVMPAMNRAHMIGRALDSVAAQTLTPREVIVVDDASTDDTVAVARAHGATVIELPVNGGSGPARNRGIEAARTRWIAFLDSDDAWLPDHLERTLARAEGYVLVAGPGSSSGGRQLGNVWRRDLELNAVDLFAPGDLVCTSGTIVTKEALLAGGLFRPLRRAQDLDMWVRVLQHGRGLALAEPTFRYFLHDQQAINDTDLMRRCYEQIVADCTEQPWFSRHDADRAMVKWHWDDLRAAQRTGDRGEVVRNARWFAARPHVWRSLAKVLQGRRLSRSLG